MKRQNKSYGLLATALLLSACLVLWPHQTPEQNLEHIAMPVQAFLIKKGSHRPAFKMYGVIDVNQHTHLESRITSNVIGQHAHRGDWVTKDQLLFTLDDADVRLAIKQKEAELTESKAMLDNADQEIHTAKEQLKEQHRLYDLKEKAYQRQKTLKKARANADAQLDAAKSTLAQQKLALLQQQQTLYQKQLEKTKLQARLTKIKASHQKLLLDLDSCVIKSPFEGRVTKTLVTVGDRVQPGEHLIELFDERTLEVKTQIPGKDLHRVLQQKTASLDAFGIWHGKNLHLRFDRVSGELSPGQNGMDAFFDFGDENKKSLVIGDNILLQAYLPEVDNSFILPLAALQMNDKVYRIENSQLNALDVVLQGKYYINQVMQGWIATCEDIKHGDKILAEPMALHHASNNVHIKGYVRL